MNKAYKTKMLNMNKTIKIVVDVQLFVVEELVCSGIVNGCECSVSPISHHTTNFISKDIVAEYKIELWNIQFII